MLDEISLTFVVILRLPDERSEAQGKLLTHYHPPLTHRKFPALESEQSGSIFIALDGSAKSLFFFFLKGKPV